MEKNLNASASKRQLWALFCATKKDYRNENLTYGQASDLLAKANEGRVKTADWFKVYQDACKAGQAKMKATTPTPMLVAEHQNPMDDRSPIKKAWLVESGVCGFAWVTIPYKTPENRQFINALKKKKIVGGYDSRGTAIKKSSYGGFKYWPDAMTQSIELKEAYCQGFADVLAKAGIICYIGSRLD
jgi:hypothetical protein